MAFHTKVNGSMAKDKDMECKYGQTTRNMLDSGKTIKQMVEASSITQMVTSTMVNGWMIRLADLVLTLITMEHSTLVNGKKISNGAEENRYGLMAKSTKENTKKVSKMV